MLPEIALLRTAFKAVDALQPADERTDGLLSVDLHDQQPGATDNDATKMKPRGCCAKFFDLFTKIT